MIQLRPHHFMCIQLFTGHGYNAEFTAHMTQKIELLAEGAAVRVQEGCDDICQKCPNREDNACRVFEKVRRLDEGVMAACGIEYGDELQWNEIASTVRERILNTELFGEICCDCEWYSLCRETLAKVDL